jgi:PEP-CTERM motif
MREFWIGVLTMGCCALAVPRVARGGLLLSFDQSGYTITSVGGTVDVPVYVSQVAGGPQVASGNELLTAGIVVSYSSPSGIAAVLTSTGVSGGALWSAHSGGASAATATLATTSLAGIADLSTPLLIGTFHFTGLSLGTTTISVADLTPGPSFETVGHDVLDPTNVATATVQVVPEPATAALLIVAVGVFGMIAVRQRRSV